MSNAFPYRNPKKDAAYLRRHFGLGSNINLKQLIKHFRFETFKREDSEFDIVLEVEQESISIFVDNDKVAMKDNPSVRRIVSNSELDNDMSRKFILLIYVLAKYLYNYSDSDDEFQFSINYGDIDFSDRNDLALLLMARLFILPESVAVYIEKNKFKDISYMKKNICIFFGIPMEMCDIIIEIAKEYLL
jgi:hypothetical protein